MEMYNGMYFIGKSDGPSIEKYIAHYKLVYPQWWRLKVKDRFIEDAKTWWWRLVNHERVYRLKGEEFENLFLDKWSRAKQKDNASPTSLSSFKVHTSVQIENLKESQLDQVKKDDTNGLFSWGMFILQVYGCIQHEKVIVAIHPSCKHNYINFDLTHRLKVPTKNICSTQVDDEHVQVFKDLKVTIDK